MENNWKCPSNPWALLERILWPLQYKCMYCLADVQQLLITNKMYSQKWEGGLSLFVSFVSMSQVEILWIIINNKFQHWQSSNTLRDRQPAKTVLLRSVALPPIYLHSICAILQFEISSLMNWIFFLAWTGFFCLL